MERNREARRGTMAAASNGGGGGGGLSRRRQRNSNSFRESPEEDGRMEIQETSRLRDRGAKKDRDRDRSSRSRRRRGERMLHASNRDRDEGDESSEESMDQDDEDEDEDLSVPLRLPPSSPPLPTAGAAAAASSPQQNHLHNHHHHLHLHNHHQQPPRKSFPPKAVKWKADEMIGVPVPRKARSASTKRSHEHSASGVGGGTGEQITRQASTSPSRMSPASTAQLSPTSSNGSLRRKMKPISSAKQRPSKISKTASLIQDEIEIEVAEVLFGMTRQFECLPKQESHKLDSRDVDGGFGNETKSRVSSPSSSPAAYQPALPSTNSSSNLAPLSAIAPKRKRPRPVKFEEESPTSPVGLHNLSSLSSPSVAKMDQDSQAKPEASSPRSEKSGANPAFKNGGGSVDVVLSQAGLSDVQQQELAMAEKNKIQDLHQVTGAASNGDKVESKVELVSSAKGDVDVNRSETAARKIASDCHKEEKFKIDLMAPPPGKLSPDRDDFNDFDPDHNSLGPHTEMTLQVKKEKAVEKFADSAVMRDEQQIEKPVQKDNEMKKQTIAKQNLDLQFDIEKPKKDDAGLDKMQSHKQQAKYPKVDSKQEKTASSLHVPLTVGAWPGGFPPYGYMGQVPALQAVVAMDGTAGPPSSLQVPPFMQMHPRTKRCSTHGYIAQMIANHQKFVKMNSFWTAAAAPFYGAKPYSPNGVSPQDTTLAVNPLQGGFLGSNAGPLQDTKGAPPLGASYNSNTPQDKMLQANNSMMEAAQRKQLILQQMPQSVSASNIPSPAFIFPINQQQAAAAATVAAAAAANRTGGAKSPGLGAEVRTSGPMSSAVGSGVGGGSATSVNLNFAGLPPNDAQYVAFLQNNGYPFPIPAPFTGHPFRGTSNAQAMPFFYHSHMLQASQLRPPQQQPVGSLPLAQQNYQNPSTLSCSSSQKHSQQSINSFPTTNQRQDLLAQQARPKEGNKAMDDNPPPADGTISQSQKGYTYQSTSMPFHPQNLGFVSTAAAAMQMGNGGGHADKQPIYQQAQPKQNMKVELLPQAFTIPFASFGGPVNTPPGLDFSSMVQNHAILQNLPDNSKHGYYQMAPAAVAGTPQPTEQKKVQVSEDGKPVARESIYTNVTVEEDRKASKPTQHSLSFAKADGEPPISSVLNNNMIDMSSRSVNLSHSSANGTRPTDRSTGTASATTAHAATAAAANSPHQQHLIHIPKHQQQQLQIQHHLTSARPKHSVSGTTTNTHPESGASTSAKFPHALTGFSQALVQGGSGIQWPQGKPSAGRGADPSVPTPAPLVKNNILQLQSRASQQSLPAQSHQTQISFGINTNKVVAPGHLSGACGSPSPSSAAIAVASPPNSISKSAGGSSSPSASAKPGSQTPAILLPQPSAGKQSASSSSSKSNASNPNMPSILGHPQKVAAANSGTKQQQQQSQQPKQQSFSEAQLFFSNPHLQQVQCAQSNASAQYYQKRQTEQTRPTQAQQLQQHNSLCAPSALALAGVPTTHDPAKAMSVNTAAAANNLKGLPQPSFLNAAQLAVAAQSASGSPRPPISATFSYMPLPQFSMKPTADQKPAAGNDNLPNCWQPEKR